ncbi:hypothetical protein [Candidatus Korobacter versatilis]|nr:hypothetical protein [Candidatus Koribacter versatilis]
MTTVSRLAVSVFGMTMLAGTLACTKLAPPKPGVKELQSSREAVRAAWSWQEDASVNESGRWTPLFLSKVECLSRRDMMWTMRPVKEELDSQGRMIVHEIWFDGTWYTSDGRYWETLKDADKKIPGKLNIGCGEGPARVWDGSLYSELDEVIRKGAIVPGEKMTANGFDCTWFDVSLSVGEPPRYTVCINAASNLPQVVRSRENGHEYTYTLSQWNTASVGVPPELSR